MEKVLCPITGIEAILVENLTDVPEPNRLEDYNNFYRLLSTGDGESKIYYSYKVKRPKSWIDKIMHGGEK